MKRRADGDVHALDAEGMVLCNPRDREAAHRAEVGDIRTGTPTCPKCLAKLRDATSGSGGR